MRISVGGALLACVLLGATIAARPLLVAKVDPNQLRAVPIDDLPMVIGSWHGRKDAPLDERSAAILQLDGAVKRVYRNSQGKELYVYIGYWKSQSGDNQAAKHSPVMCLPANGWTITQPAPWDVPTSHESEEAGLSSFTASSLIADYKGHRSLFKYWFFSGEEMFRDETQALVKTSFGMLAGSRTDGGIVEVTVPIDDSIPKAQAEAEAEQLATDFTRGLYPALVRLIRTGVKGA